MTTKLNLKNLAATVAAVFLSMRLEFCKKCVTLQAEKFINHYDCNHHKHSQPRN